MPNDNIMRCIKKASGEMTSDNYEEIINKEGEKKLKNVKKDVPVDVDWANEF